MFADGRRLPIRCWTLVCVGGDTPGWFGFVTAEHAESPVRRDSVAIELVDRDDATVF